MRQVKNRFGELVARRERIEKRRYTIRGLAEEIGISETSVKNWKYNYATRFDEAQILAITRWLGCGIADLLIIEGDEESPESNTPLAVAS